LNKIKTTLYNSIRNSKNIDGRSFQKYINQVSGIKAKEENRKKLMDLYDTISEISKGGEKATFKTIAEVKRKKEQKYFKIDVILYRDLEDNGDIKSLRSKYGKQKVIKKYTASFLQYGFVQLSVKAPKTCPPHLIDKFITERYDKTDFKQIFKILLTN